MSHRWLVPFVCIAFLVSSSACSGGPAGGSDAQSGVDVTTITDGTVASDISTDAPATPSDIVTDSSADSPACTDECATQCSTGADLDGDGHPSIACGGDDCDDTDANRYPGRMEICDALDRDEDCDAVTFGVRDGDGDMFPDARCCNVTTDGTRNCGIDCNDTLVNVHPSASEVCDGFDNDCDGMTDEGVLNSYYEDQDRDGHGSETATSPMMVCTAPPGYAATHDDCDDTNDAVHPGAVEQCDSGTLDENCDGMANPSSLCTCSGDISMPCTLPGACASGMQRCVGGSWGACSIGPVAETCNEIDDDCDGTADEDVTVSCYADADNDSYATAGATPVETCFQVGREMVGGCPPNLTNRAPSGADADCNDSNFARNPMASELCDTAMLDENCDGEANPLSLCSCSGSETRPCDSPGACAAGMQTCTNGMWGPCSISPVPEVCNNADDDCDGQTDESGTMAGYFDGDHDGYGVSNQPIMGCPGPGFATIAGDCKDNNVLVHPNQSGMYYDTPYCRTGSLCLGGSRCSVGGSCSLPQTTAATYDYDCSNSDEGEPIAGATTSGCGLSCSSCGPNGVLADGTPACGSDVITRTCDCGTGRCAEARRTMRAYRCH